MQQQASTSSETELAASKRRYDGAKEEEDDEIFDFVVVQPEKVDADHSRADAEFKKRFLDNTFGYACSVCDRLWFDKDLRSVPRESLNLLTR
jgi:hypothetical protein